MQSAISPIVILATAVGLAMDAFAVCVATSLVLGRPSARQIFRFAFHFGLFQGLMPIIGWLAGSGVRDAIMAWGRWVAGGVLVFIGAKAVWAALGGGEEPGMDGDPTRGWSLVGLSVATSLDALAVGFGFAAIGVSVWTPALVIGMVTGALAALGMFAGRLVGERWSRWAQVAGGLVLVGIGVEVALGA